MFHTNPALSKQVNIRIGIGTECAAGASTPRPSLKASSDGWKGLGSAFPWLSFPKKSDLSDFHGKFPWKVPDPHLLLSLKFELHEAFDAQGQGWWNLSLEAFPHSISFTIHSTQHIATPNG